MPATGLPPHYPPGSLESAAYAAYHSALYSAHLPHAYRCASRFRVRRIREPLTDLLSPCFRLEEQLYLERCGLLRPPMYPLPSPFGHPLYALRYPPPPDLMAAPMGLMSPVMHERYDSPSEPVSINSRERKFMRNERN